MKIKAKLDISNQKQIQAYLLYLLNEKEKSLKKSRSYPVGTIRTWNNKKYKKVSGGKWVRFYSGESRGKNMAIAIVKKQIQKATTYEELVDIVKKNRVRFETVEGKTDPIVKQLLDLSKKAKSTFKPDLSKENLVKIGGNLWENYGHSRVYFGWERLSELLGLDIGRYKTGNVSSATRNGESISNSEAKRILNALGESKFHYDLKTNKFTAYLDNKYFDPLIDAIKKEVSAIKKEVPAKKPLIPVTAEKDKKDMGGSKMLSIKGYNFNIKELDVLFGLHVGTHLMGYSGVDRSKMSSKVYPTLYKEGLIDVQKGKIKPTDKGKELIESSTVMKEIYDKLDSLDKNDLPYNGFFEGLQQDYEDFQKEKKPLPEGVKPVDPQLFRFADEIRRLNYDPLSTFDALSLTIFKNPTLGRIFSENYGDTSVGGIRKSWKKFITEVKEYDEAVQRNK